MSNLERGPRAWHAVRALAWVGFAALGCTAARPALAAAPALAITDSTRTRWLVTLDAGVAETTAPEIFRDLYEPGFGGGLGIHKAIGPKLALSGRAGYLNLPFDAGDNPYDVGLVEQGAQGALNWVDGTAALDLELMFWLQVHARAGYGYCWGRSFEVFQSDGTIGVYNPDGGGVTYGAGLSFLFPAGDRIIYIEAGWLGVQRADDAPQQIMIRAGSTVP